MVDSLTHPPSWLYFFNITLVLIAIFHMLYQRRSPQNLMAWLLALLLLPFIGILLYILFGSRKLFSKRNIPAITITTPLTSFSPPTALSNQITHLLQSNQLASTTHGNQCSLYDTPEAMYQQLMHEIQHAQTSIHLQTYHLQADSTGTAILEALTHKAQQGIQVCLLMDGIGSFSLYLNRSPLQALMQAGGHCAFFQPLVKSLLHGQINLRNHRKIYLFDQNTLLTGGINLAHSYLGKIQNPPHPDYWKDLMLKAKGPIVTHFQTIFNADWLYTTQHMLSPPAIPQFFPSQDIIQTIPSGPDIENDTLFETLLHTLYSAKHTIQIVTPYFIPDSAIMNALLIAIKRGVHITLITPKKSDHRLFDIGRSSYLRELAEHGGNIFFHQPTMLHAKLILIDQECLILGSANLDYRSLFINHEIVTLIYSKKLILHMQTWINQLHHHSQPYHPHSNKLYRYLENFSRIFTPLL